MLSEHTFTLWFCVLSLKALNRCISLFLTCGKMWSSISHRLIFQKHGELQAIFCSHFSYQLQLWIFHIIIYSCSILSGFICPDLGMSSKIKWEWIITALKIYFLTPLCCTRLARCQYKSFPFPLVYRSKSCLEWTQHCQGAKANHLFSGLTRPRKKSP